MRRKNTTKQRGGTTLEDLRAVAYHLAALIQNPATPVALYNQVTEWVADAGSDYHNGMEGRKSPGYDDHLFYIIKFDAEGR